MEQDILELAQEMGFEHWLGTTANRGWFTCQLTGKKFRGQAADEMLAAQAQAILERQEEIAAQEAVAEEQEQAGEADRMTERLATHIQVKVVTEGRPPKTTVIACQDCRTPREIKVQDVFQVTRCVDCQKKHRQKKSAERRKQRRQTALSGV